MKHSKNPIYLYGAKNGITTFILFQLSFFVNNIFLPDRKTARFGHDYLGSVFLAIRDKECLHKNKSQGRVF